MAKMPNAVLKVAMITAAVGSGMSIGRWPDPAMLRVDAPMENFQKAQGEEF